MKMVIHVIKEDGGMITPSVTLCGRSGMKKPMQTYYRNSGTGELFKAVLASNREFGPTCNKCKNVASVMRSRGGK